MRPPRALERIPSCHGKALCLMELRHVLPGMMANPWDVLMSAISVWIVMRKLNEVKRSPGKTI